MIAINMPGFYKEYDLALAMIDLQLKYPHIFKDRIKFTTVYDSFPTIWTGGRSTAHDVMVTKEEIKNKITPFLDRGVNIRYNFTNSCLTEEHLSDINSNNIVNMTLEILKDYKDANLGITIYSPLLKEYLEKTYPGLYYVWSTTLGKIGIDKVNELSEKDLLVLDYNYNNDFDFLKQLKYPEHIEILANEHCVPNCPYRDKHWHLVSEAQLTRNENLDTGCLNKVMKTKYGHGIQEKIVSVEQMINDYFPLGINKMKLAGRREYKIGLARQYMNILIKPEYREEVFKYLLKNYLA